MNKYVVPIQDKKQCDRNGNKSLFYIVSLKWYSIKQYTHKRHGIFSDAGTKDCTYDEQTPIGPVLYPLILFYTYDYCSVGISGGKTKQMIRF